MPDDPHAYEPFEDGIDCFYLDADPSRPCWGRVTRTWWWSGEGEMDEEHETNLCRGHHDWPDLGQYTPKPASLAGSVLFDEDPHGPAADPEAWQADSSHPGPDSSR